MRIIKDYADTGIRVRMVAENDTDLTAIAKYAKRLQARGGRVIIEPGIPSHPGILSDCTLFMDSPRRSAGACYWASFTETFAMVSIYTWKRGE